MSESKPANVERPRASSFQWVSALVATGLLVLVPVGIYLVSVVGASQADFERQAQRRLVDVAQAVVDWVDQESGQFLREHCACRAETGDFCLVSREPIARGADSVPEVSVGFTPHALVLQATQLPACPARVVARTVAGAAPSDALLGSPDKLRKTVPLAALLARLQATFEVSDVLDSLIVERRSPSGPPERLLVLGTPPVSSPKRPLADQGVPLADLVARRQPYRFEYVVDMGPRITLDADEAGRSFVVQGFAEPDQWSDNVQLAGAHVYIVTLLLLLLILTWPAFKVALLGPLERVALRDVMHLLVGTTAAIGVATTYLSGALLFHDYRQQVAEDLHEVAENAAEGLTRQLRALGAPLGALVTDLDGRFSAAPNRPAGLAQALVARFPDLRREPTDNATGLDAGLIDSLDAFVASVGRLGQPSGTTNAGFELELDQLAGHAGDGSQLVKLSFEGTPPTALYNYADRPYFSRSVLAAERADPGQAGPVVVQMIRSRSRDKALLMAARSAPLQNAPAPGPDPTDALEIDLDAPKVWGVSLALRAPSGLAAGTQVALVNQDGAVLAHTDAQRAMVENLFEATNQSDRLRYLVASQKDDELDLEYYGKRQMAHVTPVLAGPGFELVGPAGDEQWSVVTLREDGLWRGLVADALGLSLLVLGGLCLLRLAHGLLNLTTWGGRAEWWWPGEVQDRHRRLSLAVAAFVQLGLCLCVADLVQGLGLLEMLLVAGFVVVFTLSLAKALLTARVRAPLAPRLTADVITAIGTGVASVAAVVALRLGASSAASVWLAITVCAGCAAALSRLRVRRQGNLLQLILNKPTLRDIRVADADVVPTSSRKTVAWKPGRFVPLYAAYPAFVLSAAALFSVFGNLVLFEVAHAEASGLGAYMGARHVQASEVADASLCHRPEPWAQELLGILPFVDRRLQSVRDAGRLSVAPSCGVAAWRNGTPSNLASRDLIAVAGWLLVTSLSAMLVLAVSRRVFGLGIVRHSSPRWSSRLGEVKDDPFRFVQGSSGASVAPPAVDAADTPLRDRHVRLNSGVNQLSLLEVDLASLGAEAQPLRVIFEGCEMVLADAALRVALLPILEQLVAMRAAGHAVSVVLLSERGLLSALSEREREFATSPIPQADELSSVEMQRWAYVLGFFSWRGGVAPGALAEPTGDLLMQYLNRELAWDPQLRLLIAPLHAALKEPDAATGEPWWHDRSENEVLERIVTVTGPRHRYLWGTCTEQEKLFLIHLASEGFVNPRRWAMARRLCRRGMVQYGPHYRIRARSFAIFIARALPPEALSAWERDFSASQWRRTSTALAFAVLSLAGVVSLGYPELVEGRFGVALTTIAGWLMVASRMKLLTGAGMKLTDSLGQLFRRA